MQDEIFNVYKAVAELNERLKAVEKSVPDYNSDLLEIARSLGTITKRLEVLEEKLSGIID